LCKDKVAGDEEFMVGFFWWSLVDSAFLAIHLANKLIKQKHPAREQEGKKKKFKSKSKQNITPKNAEPTMGSPKRRKHET
jgi:hypothetical protein